MDADVLIVGAGLAGAAAAQALHEAGCHLHVVDKGRGPGGRLSTRRTPTGAFDHGTAALQAETWPFVEWLDAETRAGRAARWAGGYVGIPGMNTLVAGLLDGIDVHWSAAVAALRRDGAQWQTVDMEGHLLGTASALVLAIPAPQAAALLRASALPADVLPAALIPALEAVRYSACWAALLQTTVEARPVRMASGADDGIEALYREAEKPGRTDAGHWVLQASAAWSEAHLECGAPEVAIRLRDAFLARTGIDAGAIHEVSAHRWRYARPLAVLDPRTLQGSQFFLAGDVFGAPEMAAIPPAERAWLSGRAAAARLIAERQPKS